jgi:hypothetical protein
MPPTCLIDLHTPAPPAGTLDATAALVGTVRRSFVWGYMWPSLRFPSSVTPGFVPMGAVSQCLP